MANNDDNAIVRVERDGVEYFTVKATGESGMSQTGLARACGKSRQALIKLEKDLVTKAPSKWLKPFVGKDLTLVTNCVKNGGLVLVYSSNFCSATIKHYAYLGSEKAQDFDSALGTIGLTSYIQSQTGWLSELLYGD